MLTDVSTYLHFIANSSLDPFETDGRTDGGRALSLVAHTKNQILFWLTHKQWAREFLCFGVNICSFCVYDKLNEFLENLVNVIHSQFLNANLCVVKNMCKIHTNQNVPHRSLFIPLHSISKSKVHWFRGALHVFFRFICVFFLFFFLILAKKINIKNQTGKK